MRNFRRGCHITLSTPATTNLSITVSQRWSQLYTSCNEDDLEVAHQSTLPLHVNIGSERLPPSPSQAEKAFLLIASKTLTVFSNGFRRAPQPRYCVCQGEDTDE